MIDVFAGVSVLILCVCAALALLHLLLGAPRSRLGRILRILVVTLLITPCLMSAAWRFTKSRDYQVCGAMAKRVATSRPVVALTFDDGPTEEFTNEVLGILREKKVRATFFLTGKELEQHMAEAKRIAADGHELGNHSFSHRRMLACSTSFIRHELEKTDELIRSAGYEGAIHFRPPYGKRFLALPLYLWQTNRVTILFDVEPESFPAIAADADKIVARVVDKAQPGSIILLHLMYPARAESRKALPRVIDGLRAKGYDFVTVSELLVL